MLSNVLRWCLCLASLAPFAYYLLATYSAQRFFREQRRRRTTTGDFMPPVSILKPVRGLDRDAYENFASFCQQDYPSYEILFCVSDEDDPAIPIIQKLGRDYPHQTIRLLIGAEDLGSNRKVNKLCRLAREARYDMFVISDSDVRVDPDYLRAVVGPLADRQVGAVTCMYRALADRQLGAELEAVGTASDYFAGVLVARQLEGLKFGLGSTMATTRQCVGEIGGFEELVDQHSDDFVLGSRIAEVGYRVELSVYSVWTIYPAHTPLSYFAHQLRWSRTTRFCRPWGYLGLLLTYGLPWSLAAAAVAPSARIVAAYLGTYLVLRYLMAWTVGLWGLQDPVLRRRWWLVPLRDAIQFCVWLASFYSNRIIWRGSEFRIYKDRMVAAGCPSPLQVAPARRNKRSEPTGRASSEPAAAGNSTATSEIRAPSVDDRRYTRAR